MSQMAGRIALGKIGKAHGIQGAFRLWPYADNLDRFEHLNNVTLANAGKTLSVQVQSARVAGRYVIIQTDAIDTPEDVRPWLGGDLEVDASERVQPGPGLYFHDEIIGLTVETVSGETIGEIAEIIEAPAHDVYVCRRGDQEFLIPAVGEFIKEFDITGGRLLIDPIPGMLE